MLRDPGCSHHVVHSGRFSAPVVTHVTDTESRAFLRKVVPLAFWPALPPLFTVRRHVEAIFGNRRYGSQTLSIIFTSKLRTLDP